MFCEIEQLDKIVKGEIHIMPFVGKMQDVVEDRERERDKNTESERLKKNFLSFQKLGDR